MGRLERELGCGDSLVSKWCRGARFPGRDFALALERILGVPASSWSDEPEIDGVPAPTGTDGV